MAEIIIPERGSTTLTNTIGDTKASFEIEECDNETGVIVTMDGKEFTIPLYTFLNFIFSEKE
jgi:hypothetical protein